MVERLPGPISPRSMMICSIVKDFKQEIMKMILSIEYMEVQTMELAQQKIISNFKIYLVMGKERIKQILLQMLDQNLD